MTEKILILGGSGYIGSRLANLLSKSYNVTILDLINNQWLNNTDIKVIDGDITQEAVIDKITETFYDVVINLISLDHHKSKIYSPAVVNKINVLPTWNLLFSFAKKSTLKRYINFSTIHVYEASPDGALVEEDSELNPSSVYGLTHIMSENITSYFNSTSNICAVNLRLSNSYGEPYFKNEGCWGLIINNLCLNAFKYQKIEIKTSLKNSRNFIHYLDIFEAVKLMIDSKRIKYNCYNLCGDKSVGFEEVVKIIEEQYHSIFKKKLAISVSNKPIKVQNAEYSNQRLKELKFRMETTIEHGINQVFQHLKNEY